MNASEGSGGMGKHQKTKGRANISLWWNESDSGMWIIINISWLKGTWFFTCKYPIVSCDLRIEEVLLFFPLFCIYKSWELFIDKLLVKILLLFKLPVVWGVRITLQSRNFAPIFGDIQTLRESHSKICYCLRMPLSENYI